MPNLKKPHTVSIIKRRKFEVSEFLKTEKRFSDAGKLVKSCDRYVYKLSSVSEKAMYRVPIRTPAKKRITDVKSIIFCVCFKVKNLLCNLLIHIYSQEVKFILLNFFKIYAKEIFSVFQDPQQYCPYLLHMTISHIPEHQNRYREQQQLLLL